MSVVHCLCSLLERMSRARQNSPLLRLPLLLPDRQSVYCAVIAAACHALHLPPLVLLERQIYEAEKMEHRLFAVATVKHRLSATFEVEKVEKGTYQIHEVTKMAHRIEVAGKVWY